MRKISSSIDRLSLALIAILLFSAVLAYLSRREDSFWRIITNLGDEPAYIAFTTIIYVALNPSLGVKLLATLATSGWVNVFLKNTFMLPRPPKTLWRVEARGYGFPSGHAQTSTTFWSYLSLDRKNLYLAFFATMVVVFVGYSRVYLGVHYFTDVLGGALIGFVIAFAALVLEKKEFFSDARKIVPITVIYAFLIQAIYLVYRETIFFRLGGVTLGLALYPYVRDKIDIRHVALSIRIFFAILATFIAFLLTRVASQLPHPLQMPIYTFITVTIILTPLAYSKLLSRKTLGE